MNDPQPSSTTSVRIQYGLLDKFGKLVQLYDRDDYTRQFIELVPMRADRYDADRAPHKIMRREAVTVLTPWTAP